MDIAFREIVTGLRALGLGGDSHVVAHASLSSFGHVRGGPEAVAGALTAVCGTVIMPAFTYQTMVVPREGPPDNGITYGDHDEKNLLSEFWRPDLPVHRTVGAVSEALRHHREACRSDHPVLSFVAVGRLARQAVDAQLLTAPLAPLDVLVHAGGDLLLMGVGLACATVIHLGERRAGRRTFLRWALVAQPGPAAPGRPRAQEDIAHEAAAGGAPARRSTMRQLLSGAPDAERTAAREIPGFPGCSNGFDALAPHIAGIGRSTRIGSATVWRYPLAGLVDTVVRLIREDPAALLCGDAGCERCAAVKAAAASWQPAAAP